MNNTINDLKEYAELLKTSFEGINNQIDWLRRNLRLSNSQRGFVLALLKGGL